MPPYQARGKLLKPGMTENAVYGQTLIVFLASNLQPFTFYLCPLSFVHHFAVPLAVPEMALVPMVPDASPLKLVEPV